MDNSRQEVIDRERHFHNERFGKEEDPRKFLNKWYYSIRHGAGRHDDVILSRSKNADVLEYGCSNGGVSIDGLCIYRVARSVVGIDISDVAVANANERALKAGARNMRFVAMNAEEMTFDDASFDFVYGRGIIHHLDLERCFAEVARVLRPGGSAAFFEPMGYNPVLNAYRDRTPDIRTPDEHPMVVGDFTLAKRYFSDIKVEYFGLFSVVSAVIPTSLRGVVYSTGKAVDSLVLRVPYINRLAWYCLIVLTK